jgi:hypothetical protein
LIFHFANNLKKKKRKRKRKEKKKKRGHKRIERKAPCNNNNLVIPFKHGQVLLNLMLLG